MVVTIVTQDSLVIVDGISQQFDYSDLINASIWAVQWDDTVNSGSEEDINSNVTTITDFSPYQPILDIYNENEVTIDTAIQISLNVVEVTYKSSSVVEMTPAEAKEENISYTDLDLTTAKVEKVNEAREDGKTITNDLFDSVDVLAQIKTRTMLSYKWSSLNSKSSLTPSEQDDIVTYNNVLEYLDVIDEDMLTNDTNINALTTTQEVMDYVITFTPIPPELQDTSNKVILYMRSTSKY